MPLDTIPYVIFLSKRGRNGIQSSNHSIIQTFKHSSNAIVITFTKTFTKIRLKIPYSLSFPLSLTNTAIFLKNLIP
ncbi:hypothetical protein AB991_02560 [Helicobacter pylori]|nr:hypothetical protein AB991_02560 [Helicobacter pylori]